MESGNSNASEKTKLGLHLPSDPRWVNIAQMDIQAILSDHAWCEQKAATSCISLIVNYSRHREILDTVSPIVAEEWGHFRKVIKELHKRGLTLEPARKDEYVNKLLALRPKGLNSDNLLLERLLYCALIEARSCERFRLLSIHISDKYLKEFYREFMESEAGHYHEFIKLARIYSPADAVKKRWHELLEAEAKFMTTLEIRADRFH
jgi:tRNA-(ms[2]io[6]A)-hydroxylase